MYVATYLDEAVKEVFVDLRIRWLVHQTRAHLPETKFETQRKNAFIAVKSSIRVVL